MQHDNVCDPQCNNAACKYDSDKCRCTPQCSLALRGLCRPECLTFSCGYDNFKVGGCSDNMRLAFALFMGILAKDMDAVITYDACFAAAPSCTDAILQDAYWNDFCYPECNIPECAYSMGMCMPYNSKCWYGYKPEEGSCYWCKSGYVNYKGTCVSFCPRGTETRSWVHRMMNLCYPGTDTTTLTHPDVLYVVPAEVYGPFALANKYMNILDAMADAWQAYSIIYLVGEECVYNPDSFRSIWKDSYNSFPNLPDIFIDAKWKQLTISSIPCYQEALLGCVNQLSTLQFANLRNHPISGKVIIFSNLILTTRNYFQFQKLQYYPAFIQQNGYKVNDRGQHMSDEDIGNVSYEPFKELSLFTVFSDAELHLLVSSTQNVTVADVTVQLKALFLLQGGVMHLENTKFINVQPRSGGLGAVILQSGACSNLLSCGSFNFSGGAVSYVNNGYEITPSLVLNPFIQIDAITHFEVTGVDFIANFVANQSFISLHNFVSFNFANCRISNGVFVGSFLSIISNNQVGTDISMSELQVKRTFVRNAFIRVVMGASQLGIGISNLTFEDSVVSEGSFLDISRTAQPTKEETNSTLIGNVISPPKVFSLSNCSFTRVVPFSSLISLINLVNVEIFKLTVNGSGEGKADILQKVLDYPSIYMRKLPMPSTICSSLLYLQSVINFEMSDISISNSYCALGSTGIAIFDSTGSTSIQGFTFTSNSGGKATALLLSNVTKVVLKEFEGVGNSATTHGLIGVLAESSLEVFDSFFKNNMGEYGSCIHAEDSVNITIERCGFLRNTASATDGGALHIVPSALSSSFVLVADSEFTDNSAYNGGAIALKSNIRGGLLHFRITRVSFQRNRAVDHGSALFTDLALNITNDNIIDYCAFSEESTKNGVIALTHRHGLLSIAHSAFNSNRGSVCSGVSVGSTIYLWDVTFANSSDGPALMSLSGQPAIINSLSCRFLNSEQSAARLDSATWTDSSSRFQGSAATAVLLNGVALFRSTEFLENASEGVAGAVRLAVNSKLVCSDCAFLRNTAKTFGGALFAERNSMIQLQQCTFSGNSAGDLGLIYAFQASLVLDSVKLSNNEGQGTSGLLLISSNLTATNSYFENQSGEKAAFFVLERRSSAYVASSHFSNCSGNSASVAFLSASAITIEHSTFTNCSGVGSGLLMAGSNSTVEFTGVNASDITSLERGSVISASEDSAVAIATSVFERCEPEAVAGVALSSLAISQSMFSGGSGKLGAAVHCSDCQHVSIAHSQFTQQISVAGAVYLSQARYASIHNVSFTDNQADTGGGVHIIGGKCSIAECSFAGNAAREGGGVYFGCLIKSACELRVVNTSFERNSAVAGGGIKWSTAQPSLSSVRMADNVAKYGPDYAGIPVSVKVFSPMQRLNDTALAPGQETTHRIAAALVDQFDQVVITDSLTEAVLSPVDPGLVAVTGNTREVAESGVFVFENFTVFGPPGTVVGVEVSSGGLISSILAIQLRECLSGESTTPNSCKVCGANRYSFDPSLPCKMCPKHAECLGHTIVIPQPGYWRSNLHSEKIWECPRKAACLGGVAGVGLTGLCADGYQGNLCHSCQKGFARKGNDKCEKCPNPIRNYIVTLFVLFAIFTIVAVLVWASRKAVLDDNSVYAAYFKLMVNYSQVMFIITNFKLNWPDDVMQILDAQGDSGSSVTSIFAIDCFLVDEDYSDQYFYAKKIFASLFPIGLFVLLLIFSVIVVYWKRKLFFMKYYCLASVIVIYFLIYPTLVTSFFQLFSCIQIEKGEYWLFAEMSIRCWNDEHYKYVFIVGIPSVIVWVFGLPLMCLSFVTKFRRTTDPIVQLQYSFLVTGYKSDYFYWEFLILGRKVAIIACYYFFPNLFRTQSLTVSIVLYLCLIAQHRLWPHTTLGLNCFEVASIVVEIITIYTGMFFLSDDLSDRGRMCLFVFVAISNLVFLVGWFVALVWNIIYDKIVSHRHSLDAIELLEWIKLMRAPSPSALQSFPYITDADVHIALLKLKLNFHNIPSIPRVQSEFRSEGEHFGEKVWPLLNRSSGGQRSEREFLSS